MQVYGYCRVSTQRQVAEGESLDVQRRQIEGYAAMHGWAAPTIITEEGVSGSKPLGKREKGEELLAALKPGAILIAAKLDRLFRSAIDALTMVEEFKQGGVHLHLIDLGGDISGNGLGKLFLTIAAAFAEAERDRIRARVTEVKADQRRRGRYLGGKREFGWRIVESPDRKGGELVPDSAEQEAIQRMIAMDKDGETLRGIAAAMQADGFDISHVGVSRILKRRE
jgi:putative DNA-invertase from lambdoid prophage Rac